MSVAFYRGQQLGREDLNVFLDGASGSPTNVAEISYALYDFTTGMEALVGPPRRTPANPSVGEYYSNIVIPLDANLGPYRIRWSFRETVNGPIQSAVQEFAIVDRAVDMPSPYSSYTVDLVRRLRILLRDNCIGGEELIEVRVDGELMLVSMQDLYEKTQQDTQPSKLQTAFQKGSLCVKSVSPEGTFEWKPVLAMSQAEVGPEHILRVTTNQGSAILTAGHRVFLSPTEKVEAERLQPGDVANGVTVLAVSRLPDRQYMYDLTADDWHNFILYRSALLVSNSPDRNYHFRPPSHSETIRQYNQVFGFIWEDDEMVEYLDRGLDMVIAAPPRTPFNGIDHLMQSRPEWKTLVLTGAMIHALQALRINWISDEFSLSPDTLVEVILPDGRVVESSVEDLYDACKS